LMSSNKKKSMVLIDPDVLHRIQQDIDQEIDFKKVCSKGID
jgi:hypothetical protein